MSEKKKIAKHIKYEVTTKFRNGPSEEEYAEILANSPTMRRCLDCNKPVNAYMERCPHCGGINFKVVY